MNFLIGYGKRAAKLGLKIVAVAARWGLVVWTRRWVKWRGRSGSGMGIDAGELVRKRERKALEGCWLLKGR